MSFSISGSVITQSGTDANLAGLSGIGGVTVSSQADINVYNIGDRRLVINGTLTIEPEKETLLIGYYSGDLVQVNSGGHLIIGNAITKNGFVRYSEGLAIYCDDSGSGFTNRFSFKDGSSFTWNGGVISIQAGKFGFYGDSCSVRINSSNAKLIFRTADPRNQIRQETNDFISSGFSFIGGDMTIVGTQQQLNGYIPTHCTGSLAFSGATPNEDVIIRGYSGGGRGNEKDVKFWGGCRPYLINSLSGTELNAGYHLSGNDDSSGIARVFQELSLNVKEFGAGYINGAKLYFQDYDNGNRRIYDQEAPSIDLTGTRTYIGTSDANGDIASQEVLIGSVIADNSYGTSSDAVNTGRYSWDYRGKNGDITDLFDMQICSYNHFLLSLADVKLKGDSEVVVNATMFIDTLITEVTKTTVDAYTTIDTANQFYDRAKSYLYDNYAGETDTLVSRNGTLIDLGAYDLDIDASAVSAFSVSGNKITIKSSAFADSLTTTGTITLLNGATVLGTRTDTNGTIAPPLFVTLTGLKTNSEVRAYVGTDPATATEIAGIEDSSTSFAFNQEYAGQDGYIIVFITGYQPLNIPITYSSENQSIPIQQVIDRNYNNPI